MRDIRRLIRKGILEMESYVPGKPIEEVQAELGLTEIAKMASNECPLGPSPKAVRAMEKELNHANLYPEGPCTVLRREMSKRLGIDEDMITFSNGADNGILLVGNAFINEGDEILMADPTFFVYKTVTKIMGGHPVYVKLRNHFHDLNAMKEAIGERTKLVFVCNPNNPTGTVVKKNDLDQFVANLPEHTVLVLDEAYYDFVLERDSSDGLDYVKRGYSVISLRTLSKLYGLAGIRIGYALGSREFISVLNKVREPFPVSRIAQAGALAALEDEEFKERVLKNNSQGKAFLCQEFDRMGLPYAPSYTNFVFVDLGTDSRAIFESLLREGIIIRPGDLWNCPTYVRVTVGTMEENRKFINALKKDLFADRNVTHRLSKET